MPITLATAAPATSDSPAGLLAEITADLSSGADIRALLQHFLAPIVQIAHARAGAVRMLIDDDQLRLVGELSLPPKLGCGGATVHRHCGGCGRAVDGDEVAWDPDMSGCSAASRDTLAPMGWAHMLAVPLGHRGQVLGVYNLFFDGTQVPSDDVRSVLRSIGELLGLALHNARLESENLRATVMQERQMMAAEVHDSVAQDLAFLRMRLALPMAVLASASSIGGALLGLAMPANVVQMLMGGVVLGIVVLMAVSKKSEFPQVDRPDALSQALALHGVFVDGASRRVVAWQVHRTVPGLLMFLGIGVLAGMFGIGAGWANVPALNLLMGAPLKVSAGTSSLVLSLVDSSAAWVYINKGAVLPMIAVPSVVGMMLGARIGARLLNVLKGSVIRCMVIGVLLFAGARALLKGTGLWP